jgi:hypothetical protein
MRSNLALQAHTYHHPPALLLWCNALVREGSWWALWWGSLDGMQVVRRSRLRSHKSRLGETEGGPGSVDEIDIRDWCEVAG